MSIESNSTNSKMPLPSNSEGNNSTSDGVDNYGYDETPPAGEPKLPTMSNSANGDDTVPPPVEPKTGEEGEPNIEKKVTGYGQEKPAVPPVEPPKDEPKKDDPAQTDEEKVTEAIGSLPDGVDKDKLKKFAEDNKLSAEQIKAYGELVKSEEAESVKNREKFVAEQRSKWEAELKADKDFGGENFTLNVDRAEKVLEKYLPNMKKELTTRGTMLPPYIMRDLASLWNVMNPTQKLVEGDPIVPSANKHYLEEMYE